MQKICITNGQPAQASPKPQSALLNRRNLHFLAKVLGDQSAGV